MRDAVALVLARDPVELAEVQSLLGRAGIGYSLFVPGSGSEELFGPSVGAPSTVLVDRADLERARAVQADAWGAPPEAPE
jgi:hypothetical protein